MSSENRHPWKPIEQMTAVEASTHFWFHWQEEKSKRLKAETLLAEYAKALSTLAEQFYDLQRVGQYQRNKLAICEDNLAYWQNVGGQSYDA